MAALDDDFVVDPYVVDDYVAALFRRFIAKPSTAEEEGQPTEPITTSQLPPALDSTVTDLKDVITDGSLSNGDALKLLLASLSGPQGSNGQSAKKGACVESQGSAAAAAGSTTLGGLYLDARDAQLVLSLAAQSLRQNITFESRRRGLAHTGAGKDGGVDATEGMPEVEGYRSIPQFISAGENIAVAGKKTKVTKTGDGRRGSAAVFGIDVANEAECAKINNGEYSFRISSADGETLPSVMVGLCDGEGVDDEGPFYSATKASSLISLPDLSMYAKGFPCAPMVRTEQLEKGPMDAAEWLLRIKVDWEKFTFAVLINGKEVATGALYTRNKIKPMLPVFDIYRANVSIGLEEVEN